MADHPPAVGYSFFIPGIVFTALGAGAIHFAFFTNSPVFNLSLYQWGAALLTAQGVAFLVLPCLFRFIAGGDQGSMVTALELTGLVFTSLGFAAAVLMLIYYSWLPRGSRGVMAAEYALGVGIVALILNAPIVFVILGLVCRGMFG